ncbi:thiol-disulfide oxidoreductase ResA [Bacillus spongiae]|uniref:Thiol-disulfide oxidoreductase ResA n=1 Tax=Bacillus spongiae TaxID=2683610 RepID=A0ABU8HC95_9BACI
MKKNKRLWMRTIILAILLSAVIYTLYGNLVGKDSKQVVQVNDKAPDFILPKLNGEELKLSEFRGKAVLLNFWGSWCAPCKKEMPVIQDAYDQYKDQNVEVITINVNESELTVKNFFEKNNLSLPVVMDKDSEVYDAYGIYVLPTSFFLHPDGTVNRVYKGEITRENMSKWMNEILPEQ